MLAGFPPFQSPTLTDWWFQKLATNKHHLFWQAHSRNAYFSDHTRDFINKILTPDPSKRITLADMKKHPWFLGPTISASALHVELTRRKNEVDAAKAREKAEKKKRTEEGAVGGARGELSGDVMRGEELPLDPPNMWGRGDMHGGDGATDGPSDLDGGGMGGIMATGSLGGLSGMAFGAEESSTSVGESKTERTDRLIAERYDALAPSSASCYTRFDSILSPSVLLNRISRQLERFHGARQSAYDGQCKLKVSVLTPVGNVVFTAQVFDNSTTSGTVSVVEFRRRQGDSMHYLALFNDLRDALIDCIAPSKTATTTATTTDEPITELKEPIATPTVAATA